MKFILNNIKYMKFGFYIKFILTFLLKILILFKKSPAFVSGSLRRFEKSTKKHILLK